MTQAISTWQELEARLRQRDTDPAFEGAPVLDAYARISRNPATGEMEKTDRQLFDILTNIERRHARLGVIHRDDNLSAWKLNRKRPGWDELIYRLRNGETQGVVSWHLDRLMRQPLDLEALIELGNEGRVIGTCFGDYDLSNSDHRMILRILVATAAKEGDNISRRQKRKNEARRMAGYAGTGGYRSFGFPGKDCDAAQLEAERKAIAEGMQAHIDGLSLSAIARQWNSSGLRTTGKAATFSVVSVRAVLRRARNAGLIEHQRKLIVSDVVRTNAEVTQVEYRKAVDVEPIVSEELYLRFLAVLDSRGKGRPVTAEYFLSGGLLKCAECGKAMNGNVSSETYADGERKRYYRCPPASNTACNSKPTIDARNVEEFVRVETLKKLSDPRHASMIARKSAALAKVENEIERAEQTARELSERLGKGAISFDRYDAATRPLDARIATLKSERDELIRAGAGQSADPRDMAQIADVWANASGDERRRMALRAFPLGFAVFPAVKRRGPVSDRIEQIVNPNN